MKALAIIALALALAGCDRHGGAGGETDSVVEVLPGSASDAMIQYDTLRSQPPHAVEGPSAKLGTAVRSSDAPEAGSEPSAAPEAAPAAAPSIAVPPPAAAQG